MNFFLLDIAKIFCKDRNLICGFLIPLESSKPETKIQRLNLFLFFSGSNFSCPGPPWVAGDLWKWGKREKGLLMFKNKYCFHEINPIYGIYFSVNSFGWLTICQAIKQENVKIPHSHFGEHMLKGKQKNHSNESHWRLKYSLWDTVD